MQCHSSTCFVPHTDTLMSHEHCPNTNLLIALVSLYHKCNTLTAWPYIDGMPYRGHNSLQREKNVVTYFDGLQIRRLCDLTYSRELESSHRVRRQFDDLEKGHVHHAVGFSSTTRPILITFTLNNKLRKCDVFVKQLTG
jgi:hypothetical protein